MKFESPLLDATLLKRYKRFLSDVVIKLTGETIIAHVPNSGSMSGVSTPNSPCLVSVSPNKARKLPHTLEMVQVQGVLVGVNTSLTNKLVAEAFAQKLIPNWLKFTEIRSEIVVAPGSRLDFVMTNESGKKHFVEVKNVSMAKPPMATFPDAVTERGQKHLKDLMKLASQGHGAEIFFVVQREDCHTFRPCDEIDPEYGKLLRLAVKSGVNIQCWTCQVSPTEIKIAKPLTIDLN
jgi:sugar fermentation stimulation protein A